MTRRIPSNLGRSPSVGVGAILAIASALAAPAGEAPPMTSMTETEVWGVWTAQNDGVPPPWLIEYLPRRLWRMRFDMAGDSVASLMATDHPMAERTLEYLAAEDFAGMAAAAADFRSAHEGDVEVAADRALSVVGLVWLNNVSDAEAALADVPSGLFEVAAARALLFVATLDDDVDAMAAAAGELAAAADAKGSPKRRGEAWLARGFFLWRRDRDPGPALAALEIAATAATEARDWPLLVDVLTARGEIVAHVEGPSALPGTFAEAETVAREHADADGVAYARFRLAQTTYGLGDHDSAVDAFEAAVEAAARADRKEAQAEALVGLGLALNRQGRIKRAISTLHRAIEAAEAAGDRSAEARAHGNLAMVLDQNDRSREAIVHHRKSYDLNASLGTFGNAVIALRNQAIGESQLGLGTQSLETYERARAVARTHLADGESQIADIEFGRGNTLILMKRFDDAERAFLTSMAIEKRLGRRSCMGDNLRHLGVVERERGNVRKACGYWLESAEVFAGIGSRDAFELVMELLEENECPLPR